jgi:hypothetical protein
MEMSTAEVDHLDDNDDYPLPRRHSIHSFDGETPEEIKHLPKIKTTKKSNPEIKKFQEIININDHH